MNSSGYNLITILAMIEMSPFRRPFVRVDNISCNRKEELLREGGI